MFKNTYKIPIILSIIVIVLAIIATVGSFLIKDLYRDTEMVKGVLLGNDILTLFIAVPLMIITLVYASRGSKRAILIWMGTLWYMVYNYIFYMYGIAFNQFFLIYVALFIIPVYALVIALMKTDVREVVGQLDSTTPVKWISLFLLFFAISLGTPWIAMTIDFIVTGQVPEAILQTGHPTGVVFATDLSLLIPALLVSAILLRKRNLWGYIMTVIVMIKCLLYPLVLLVGGIISYLKVGIWDSLIPLYMLLWLGCIITLRVLLRKPKILSKDSPKSPTI